MPGSAIRATRVVWLVCKSPSGTRTICTRPCGCVDRLLVWFVSQFQVQFAIEPGQPRRLCVGHDGTDITERIDHRIDLSVYNRGSRWHVVEFGLRSRPLYLCLVLPIEQLSEPSVDGCDHHILTKIPHRQRPRLSPGLGFAVWPQDAYAFVGRRP